MVYYLWMNTHKHDHSYIVSAHPNSHSQPIRTKIHSNNKKPICHQIYLKCYLLLSKLVDNIFHLFIHFY